jgi:hypothetical protein
MCSRTASVSVVSEYRLCRFTCSHIPAARRSPGATREKWRECAQSTAHVGARGALRPALRHSPDTSSSRYLLTRLAWKQGHGQCERERRVSTDSATAARSAPQASASPRRALTCVYRASSSNTCAAVWMSSGASEWRENCLCTATVPFVCDAGLAGVGGAASSADRAAAGGARISAATSGTSALVKSSEHTHIAISPASGAAM